MPDARIANTPIFFINRNRFSALKTLVEWLLYYGFKNITILDNDSSYPLLMDWYRNLEAVGDVKVKRMYGNYGPWVLWKRNMHLDIKVPYIVSDPDLIPAPYCPGNLVQRMFDLLTESDRFDKVGPSLRLDNVPGHYAKKDLVLAWESYFWHRPVGRGVYNAPIDTTFAMYRPGTNFKIDPNKNARLGYPYTLEHTPWYIDERNLDEEEQYYRNNADHRVTSWSSDSFEERAWSTPRLSKDRDQKNVLNILCGNNYIEGWVNLDLDLYKIDHVLAPSRGVFPNLEAEYFDYIYCGAGLSRLNFEDLFNLMIWAWGVIKPNGKLFIRDGYVNSLRNDQSDNRPGFSERSFNHFSSLHDNYPNNFLGCDWEVEEIVSIVDSEACPDGKLSKKQLRHQINVVSEIVFLLRAVKPHRSRSGLKGVVQELSPPKMIYSKDPYIRPPFSL